VQINVNERLAHLPTLLKIVTSLIDVTEMIADTVTMQVSDRGSFSTIISHVGLLDGPRAARAFFLGCLLRNIKKLDINLRLPLCDYDGLEAAPEVASFTTTWIQHPYAIRNMSKLRRLRIWLDHDESCTWSRVNERTTLSPLQSLANLPTLDISINLLKLHPKYETAERHFTTNSAPSSLLIHRRYRQRYHSNDGVNVQHEPDFPVLGEYADFFGSSMEKLEEHERYTLNDGRDPMQEIYDLEPLHADQTI
jgi:hypothetical protein